MKRWSAILLLIFAAVMSRADEVPVVDTTSSPYAVLQPVGLTEARWTQGFWADRITLCRDRMLPGLDRLMEGTNYSQFYRNFEIAAGQVNGRCRGATFNDGDFYKMIEGASAILAQSNNPVLRATLDRLVNTIAHAQATNGYLDTWIQLHQRQHDPNAIPFHTPENFEVYNFGQLFSAACMNYRVTGQTNFLEVARRAADCLDDEFRTPTPTLANNLVCPAHYMGLVELYRTTHEPRYLALAKRFLAMRNLIQDGTADNQDRLPFAEQTEAEGHAVRANYLCAGAADLFLETGDTNLWRPLAALWTNVVTRKMYVTGGVGALYDGAAPYGAKDQKHITRVHQAYGRNYELPNLTAHNETCANIGNALWNWRLFLATGEARYMDVVELELYNSILSGVGLDGTNYFYSNPLRVTDPMPVNLRWPPTRVPFNSSFCCPPNLLRTVAESSGYAYSKSPGALWVNLYGSSIVNTRLADGLSVGLEQSTEYPWDGKVRLRITHAPGNEFALRLRIPDWAKGATLQVNHGPVDRSLIADAYHEIRRRWQAGDQVLLKLPMPVRRLEANPFVEEDTGEVAIQRGPVVYCLESVDLPAGIRVSDIRLPTDLRLTPRHDRHLLGGVTVLEGNALARSQPQWDNQLYRDYQPGKFSPVNLRLIPYSVWQNRGRSEMSVWLPLASE